MGIRISWGVLSFCTAMFLKGGKGVKEVSGWPWGLELARNPLSVGEGKGGNCLLN